MDKKVEGKDIKDLSKPKKIVLEITAAYDWAHCGMSALG